MADRRDRSRSPRPQRRPKKATSGFKWKDEKKPSVNDNGKAMHQQYRERDYTKKVESPQTDSQPSMKPASGKADTPTKGMGQDESGADHELDEEIVKKFGRKAAIKLAEQEKAMAKAENAEDRASRPHPTVAPTQEVKQAPRVNEKYITVWVNDRLGTKVAVPSLPSDKIGDFKIIAAHSIGRPTGQFIIKRQGERPFKDHLTLADYEISDGVQLDLEIAS